MDKTIPVILDTDIGDDCDDFWALAMLLKCPELDLRLVTITLFNTPLKACIAAKLLSLAKRTDVPIAIGTQTGDDPPPQARWAADYKLADYPGTVEENAAEVIVRTILDSAKPITLIAIGPMTTIAEALKIEPAIAERTNFVAMGGSFRHLRGEPPKPDHNIKANISASQAVFSAPWISATITPIDSCVQVVLRGERYAKLLASDDPLMREVIKSYRIWAKDCSWYKGNPDIESSILFDTAAIYLAWTAEHFQMQKIPVVVRDNGLTDKDPAGKPVNVALGWTDIDAYKDFLVERMIRSVKL